MENSKFDKVFNESTQRLNEYRGTTSRDARDLEVAASTCQRILNGRAEELGEGDRESLANAAQAIASARQAILDIGADRLKGIR